MPEEKIVGGLMNLNESLTTGHLERALTTAHLQQQLNQQSQQATQAGQASTATPIESSGATPPTSGEK
jgi:hypothetical protein